jgi:AcrR family transcriptional regulator
MARTGRRPGKQDTREAILEAARKAFGERGYDGASIRLIAAGAGVDPALVHHYFGTKHQLFLDAIQAPVDPMQVLPQVLAGGPDGFGERLVGTLVRICDSTAGGAVAGLFRSAVGNELIARMMRDFFLRQIARRVVKGLNLDPAEGQVRTSFVFSQIAGLIAARYIIKVEPLASLPPEAVVAMIGPTVQRYLTAPLPFPPPR